MHPSRDPALRELVTQTPGRGVSPVTARPGASMRLLPFVALALVGCVLPENPAVTRDVQWVDAETEELARRACYDCHSNETEWKWYHNVAGVKKQVRGHVYTGRIAMNFSEWDCAQPLAQFAGAAISSGRMPLEEYTRNRPRGRLTEEEQATLIAGIEATLAADPAGTEPCAEDTGVDRWLETE